MNTQEYRPPLKAHTPYLLLIPLLFFSFKIFFIILGQIESYGAKNIGAEQIFFYLIMGLFMVFLAWSIDRFYEWNLRRIYQKDKTSRNT